MHVAVMTWSYILRHTVLVLSRKKGYMANNPVIVIVCGAQDCISVLMHVNTYMWDHIYSRDTTSL